ncbi:MAG: adenylate/guanylate cyclase domain-containing protein [Candidatus Obscuribacterales bacterium]|jgi:class 3 adenylate cyclase|nr:adenylate/guanylate cyclase domain-containing protein [Candidatus Obscuribacterales bacterium]
MGLAGYLVVNFGTPEAYFFELEEGLLLEIGRKPSLSDGPRKLVLPVPEVSSHHAELRPGQNGWSLMDTGSTNGTQLNGSWITSGQEYLLKNGDHIKVAQVDLVVNLPENTPQRSESQLLEDEHEQTKLHIKLTSATILVADIRGFTTLMESYSEQPDKVMEAAQRIFSALADSIKKEYGQVEKIAGDAVMAYWQEAGTPDSDPNICAYQACRSALRIKELACEMAANRDIWSFADHTLQIDIALATGPVATGTLGGSNSPLSVLGDTANLAFRLEKLLDAERAGGIIVDGVTYEAAKDKFVWESLGTVTVKGRQRPVDTYLLLSH